MLVTGATGLVGAWLTRRLLEAGADVVCLVRDWVPQCELVRAGLIDRVKVVRGDIRDRDCLERAIGEYETGIVIQNGQGASIAMVGPSVSINESALVVV